MADVRFFELSDDEYVDGRWHLGDVLSPTRQPDLLGGAPFCGELEAEVTHPGRPLEYSRTAFGVPVVSAKLAVAIQAVASTDVQRLPLAIPEYKGFEVLNVLRVVECIDERRSEFLKYLPDDHCGELTGQYRMVTRLVLDPYLIPRDAHCFRLRGWVVALVVSDVVKAAMEAVGCTGARFSPVTWEARVLH